MVGRQIVSSQVLERKSKYFCRELVVYPEKRKYRTSRQYLLLSFVGEYGMETFYSLLVQWLIDGIFRN